MQRMVAKQVLFLILLAFAILLLMGTLLITNVEAQTVFDLVADWDWEDDWDDGERFSPVFRYNRVEGIFTGVRVNQDFLRRRYPRRPFMFGSAGYSFRANEFEYQAGLEKGFFRGYRLALGGEYHRLVDTPDRWMIPNLENSLAAILLKEDFHDFYLREGASGYIHQNIGKDFSLTTSYVYDKLDSLEKNVDWALFGGKKKHFCENPAMDAGEMHSIQAKFEWDGRNSDRRTTRGFYTLVEYEHAGDGLGGDFNFDRLVVDFRHYLPLGFGEGLDYRIRVGTGYGYLPWQRTFHLGGLSTLRGFKHKEYPTGRLNPGGNRMILTQFEYRMGESELPGDLGLWIFDLFNLILFFDAGWVIDAGPETPIFEGFDGLTLSDFKSDVGIALANRSGNVRFEIARRLDTGHKPFVFSFRINRAF